MVIPLELHRFLNFDIKKLPYNKQFIMEKQENKVDLDLGALRKEYSDKLLTIDVFYR